MQRLAQIAARPAIWMVAVLIAAYWQVALCHYPLQWDAVNQIFVWHRYIAECFHAHVLPLWAPYSRLGYPLYADPQSGLFYPIVWLLTLGGHYTLRSNDLEFFIHVLLAAWGMRSLLRTLGISGATASVFGVLYAMSGPMTGHATHTTLVVSMAWVPLVLSCYIQWLRNGRIYHLLLTALYVYMEVTGGYVGITIILIYVMAAVFLYHIGKQPMRSAVVIKLLTRHLWLGLFVAIVSAGFLYAVAQGQPYIDRGEGITRATAGGIPFTPVCLLTMVYPALTGDGNLSWGTDTTMQSLYIGLLPLLLVVLVILLQPGRRTVMIALASLLTLLAAMGGHTPLRGWLYDYVPLMKLFRHAGIFRLFTCIGFIVLSAIGFDAIEDQRFRRRLRNAVLVLFIMTAVIWIAGLTIAGTTVMHAIASVSLSVVCIALAALVVLALPESFLSWPVRKVLIALLLIIDLGLSVQRTMFITIACDRPLSSIQKVIDQYPRGFPLPSNDPITSYGQWNDSTIAPPLWQNAGFLRKQISFEGYNGFNLKTYNLMREQADFFQRYGHKPLVSGDRKTTIQISAFDPGRFGIEVDCSQDMQLTLAQIYFPGWRASIDKMEVPVAENADHFVSCSVPIGHHQVDFYFSPKGAKAAFIYTLLIVTMLTAGIGLYRRRLN